MPCTPNPTTGFFFYVPRQDLIELDMTVEDAMTLLMSAGMVQPEAATAAARNHSCRACADQQRRDDGRAICAPSCGPKVDWPAEVQPVGAGAPAGMQCSAPLSSFASNR